MPSSFLSVTNPNTSTLHPPLTFFLLGILFTLSTLGFKDLLYPKFRPYLFLSTHQLSSSAEEDGSEIGRRGGEGGGERFSRGEGIVDGIEGTIGNTPLIRIKSLSEATGCEILGKAEFLNGAGGSPKDRVALNIIETAEREGLIKPHSGDTIYEGTVGSTGISLATLCQAKGYKAYICMPTDSAIEKSSLLRTLGATVHLVPPASIIDPSHYVNLARTLSLSSSSSPSPSPSSLSPPPSPSNTPSPHSLFANQFETPANHLTHSTTTGPEILRQCTLSPLPSSSSFSHKPPPPALDAFISGAGTGGTLTGCALYLKKHIPSIRIILADPQGSGLYNKIKYGVMFSSSEKEGTRRRQQVDSVVEGIGCNRVTGNFEQGRGWVDDAVRVSDREAGRMSRWLVERDGIFVGGSSAVNCVAAVRVARQLGPGHRIVTILCDSGSRHLSKFWAADAVEGGEETRLTLDDILE